jgi:hypothetical protein
MSCKVEVWSAVVRVVPPRQSQLVIVGRAFRVLMKRQVRPVSRDPGCCAANVVDRLFVFSWEFRIASVGRKSIRKLAY